MLVTLIYTYYCPTFLLFLFTDYSLIASENNVMFILNLIVLSFVLSCAVPKIRSCGSDIVKCLSGNYHNYIASESQLKV